MTERYRPDDYARPSVAVDIVVLTIDPRIARFSVLLVQRNEPPFKGVGAPRRIPARGTQRQKPG